MNVRVLLQEDLDALLQLYTHLHNTDSPLPARSKVEHIWNETTCSQHIKYFGFFTDGLLTSCCMVSVIPNLTRGCRPYALIENVVTHRGFRRHGQGKAVMLAALEHALSLNCYKVMLMTGRLDEDVFRFYESLGFRRDRKQAFVIEIKDTQ